MPLIDPSTDIGRIRLKTGDTRDISILTDAVIQQVLTDCGNNLRLATATCGQYILATLAFDGQAKMGVIEIYGNDIFNQYKQYLMLMIKDPAFNSVCPIPYVAGADELHPILQFKEDFDGAYTHPTSDERLHQISIGPFDPYSGPVVNGN